jgi:hypothetical protein
MSACFWGTIELHAVRASHDILQGDQNIVLNVPNFSKSSQKVTFSNPKNANISTSKLNLKVENNDPCFVNAYFGEI